MAEALLHDLVVTDDYPTDGLSRVAEPLRCDPWDAGGLDQGVHEAADVVRVDPAAQGGGDDQTAVPPGRTGERNCEGVLGAPPLTCTFVVGLGRFELPTS